MEGIFCHFKAKTLGGLKWHQMRKHQTMQRDAQKQLEADKRSIARLQRTNELRKRARARDDELRKGGGSSGADAGRSEGGPDGPHRREGTQPAGRDVAVRRRLAAGGAGGGGPHADGSSSTGGDGRATPVADYHERLEAEVGALLEYSRLSVSHSPKRPHGNGEAPVNEDGAENEYSFFTLNTAVRAQYEQLQDFQRSTMMKKPATRRHKRGMRKKHGKFSTARLRVLASYLLSANGPGMSDKGIDNFFKFMQDWEKKPKKSKRRRKRLAEYFKNTNALKTAVHADLDAAMEDAGWMQCEFAQGGVNNEAYFLPVLDVMMQMMAGAQDVKYWSGIDGPGELTERRETPMDVDVFRLFEKDVCSKGVDNFVLGFHVYSDSHLLSGSWGKFWSAPMFFERECRRPHHLAAIRVSW